MIRGTVIASTFSNGLIKIDIDKEEYYNLDEIIEYRLNYRNYNQSFSSTIRSLLDKQYKPCRSDIIKRLERRGLDTSELVWRGLDSEFKIRCIYHNYWYITTLGGSDCPHCFALLCSAGQSLPSTRQSCKMTCDIHNTSGISRVGDVWLCPQCSSLEIKGVLFKPVTDRQTKIDAILKGKTLLPWTEHS